jgi:hypothetical protein
MKGIFAASAVVNEKKQHDPDNILGPGPGVFA